MTQSPWRLLLVNDALTPGGVDGYVLNLARAPRLAQRTLSILTGGHRRVPGKPPAAHRALPSAGTLCSRCRCRMGCSPRSFSVSGGSACRRPRRRSDDGERWIKYRTIRVARRVGLRGEKDKGMRWQFSRPTWMATGGQQYGICSGCPILLVMEGPVRIGSLPKVRQMGNLG